MLLELRINNFGIIEEIDWRLSAGLNIITGETGAGKSLVIDAIEALLSGRLDENQIRRGADEVRIEAIFDGTASSRVADLLGAGGLCSDDDSLTIRCELRRGGHITSRINGSSIPRGTLRQIGQRLVDLQTQGQHLSLLERGFQLELLDGFAGTAPARIEFGQRAGELRSIDREIKTTAERAAEAARQEDFLRFQVDEIIQAKLVDGEEEALEEERRLIAAAESLKTLSFQAFEALAAEEGATALSRLFQAVALARRAAETDARLKSLQQSLEEATCNIQETARELRTYSERLEFDPKRLEEIEARLELIRGLKRKYGPSVAAIGQYLIKARLQLDAIVHSSEQMATLAERRINLVAELAALGEALSRARREAARRLEAGVAEQLAALGMTHMHFEVGISRQVKSDGLFMPDGTCYSMTDSGVDEVEFLAITNPGEPLLPLARIASTGELSRFLLALKGALSQADKTPLVIFDEIDIGVGGRSGEVIGQKLWALGCAHQIVCVTHLPQIAAYGDSHFFVHKEEVGGRTVSRLDRLDDRSRQTELAAMLGGGRDTPESRGNASELISSAAGWKARQSAKVQPAERSKRPG